MKKIVYLTGTRADFGLMTLILEAINKDPGWELILLATGMHLMDEFGYTIKEVDKKFKVTEIIEAVFENDDRESMANFTAKCTTKIIKILTKHKPDVVMVLGDRGEQLAMSIAAAYLAVPIIHLSGGDLTTTVDDKVRHAISMLSDWHLPSSEKSQEKLVSMGVDSKRVLTVGAPGLDDIKSLPVRNKKDVIVVLQHPDEAEIEANKQIRETLKAVISFNYQIRVVYPNADAGGRRMIKEIEKFAKNFPEIIKTYKSLEREEYLQLLQEAKVLVGNSSSGLLEALNLELPVVNVGLRQQGRLKAKNVIDADYKALKIKAAVKKALFNKSFRNGLKSAKNPYGDGQTAARVLKFLKKTFK